MKLSNIETHEKKHCLKVCVCTSYRADREPRAPKHAVAIAELSNKFEVTFVECSPSGEAQSSLKILDNLENIKLITHFYPHRKSGLISLLINTFTQKIARFAFKLLGMLQPSSLSKNIVGLEKSLRKINADIYFAHNIDTLLPCARASQQLGALLLFDSMEFHSDMGDSQNELEKKIIRALENKYLKACSLVLASSEQMADALCEEYGIVRPLAIYNVPKTRPDLQLSDHKKRFSLYWRNSVIGLGQRGLDEALLALSQLPKDIELHLQGRLPIDGGDELRNRISELSIDGRVIFHSPYLPEQAVEMASVHTIGLCLERKGVRNHELTVSNKMFDYMMGGLAVIASDLPSLKYIIEKSNAGLVFEPGSHNDLAKQILFLYNNADLLQEFRKNSRDFALYRANWETEKNKFTEQFQVICDHNL